jgi:hypothetical protein
MLRIKLRYFVSKLYLKNGPEANRWYETIAGEDKFFFTFFFSFLMVRKSENFNRKKKNPPSTIIDLAGLVSPQLSAIRNQNFLFYNDQDKMK